MKIAENFYPVGTVIKLKNSNKDYMVLKRAVISKNKYYDYGVCVFPYGYDGKKLLFCKEEQIDKVVSLGYESELDKKIQEKIQLAATNFEEPKGLFARIKAFFS